MISSIMTYKVVSGKRMTDKKLKKEDKKQLLWDLNAIFAGIPDEADSLKIMKF